MAELDFYNLFKSWSPSKKETKDTVQEQLSYLTYENGELSFTEYITLSTNKSKLSVGESYTLNGFLSLGKDETVKLYNSSTLVDILTTKTKGMFTKTITPTGVGYYKYRVKYEKDNISLSNGDYVDVIVIDNDYIEFGFTGDTFISHKDDDAFSASGDVLIDWGDGQIVVYDNKRLTHTYENSDDYTIKIYGGVKYIKINSFRECEGLTSIKLSHTVKKLNTYAFRDCTSLTSVIIPDSVTSIANYCFYGCTSLTSITLPDSVTSIDEYCFGQCTSLTSINISNNITSIGDNCFDSCSSLTEIVLNWTSSEDIINYNETWIANPNANLKFIIPSGTTSLYTAKEYPSELIEEQ